MKPLGGSRHNTLSPSSSRTEDLTLNKVQRRDPGEDLNPFNIFTNDSRLEQIMQKSGLQCDKYLQNLPRFNEENITTYKKIGSGSFSNVYLANSTDSNKWYAIKRLKIKENIATESDIRESSSAPFSNSESDLLLEAAVLSSLDHEHIIHLHGISKGNILSSVKNQHFYLVLDLLQETLTDRLLRWKRERNYCFGFSRALKDEDVIIRCLEGVGIGIVKGMEYLHSRRIVFRDLKPANIGFDELHNKVKIFDFGLSRVLYNDDPTTGSRLMTLCVGTPRYMAPEIVKKERTYGLSIDVYSFGIMLWQILTNRIPFEGISGVSNLATEVAFGGKRPALKYVKCAKLRKVLKSCWSSDPRDRLSFSSIRQTFEVLIKQYS